MRVNLMIMYQVAKGDECGCEGPMPEGDFSSGVRRNFSEFCSASACFGVRNPCFAEQPLEKVLRRYPYLEDLEASTFGSNV